MPRTDWTGNPDAPKHWNIITEMEPNRFTGGPIWAAACRCGWFGPYVISQAAACVAYSHHLDVYGGDDE